MQSFTLYPIYCKLDIAYDANGVLLSFLVGKKERKKKKLLVYGMYAYTQFKQFTTGFLVALCDVRV
jgi:hypothetical protein